jgi:serine/alanine adding enzyme
MNKLKVVSNVSKGKWSEFILEHPKKNPFQTPEMLDVLEKAEYYSFIFLAVIDKDDCIQGVLLAQLQKDFKGLLGKFTARSIIWGGPLVREDDDIITELILNEYNKIAKKKAIYTQFRNLRQVLNKDIFLKSGFVYEEHLNILVNLSITEDNLWKSIKKSRKEGIRKALRNDLIFEVISCNGNVNPFYILLKNTFDSVKKPFPKSDFFVGIGKFYHAKEVKLFQLKKDDTIIASLLAFVYNNCIYAYYIGTNREHKYFLMRPIDLLYWEVMRWGVNNGIKIFDWMGAGKPDVEYGVRKFKLQYGGELLELGRFEKIHKPNLMRLGKFGLKIMQKMNSIMGS